MQRKSLGLRVLTARPSALDSLNTKQAKMIFIYNLNSDLRSIFNASPGSDLVSLT